ncbi:MAG: hypothetical protein R3F61_24535 [Myxococcota bacterium]
MAGRKIRDERDARACLDAVAVSGMERAEWARRNGVDARSLNAWRLNLDRPPAVSTTELRLVELVPECSISVFRVACGPFVVEVPARFNEAALARLLGVVAAC